MSAPIRFPRGLSTWPQKSILNSYPSVPTSTQIALTDDFLPYVVANYTLTALNGTVANVPYLGGMVKIALPGTSAADTAYLQRGGQSMQFLPLDQMWMDAKIAYVRSAVAAGSANDTTIFVGLFDTTNPATAPNAVYFVKPAGGSVVNFVIKKAGVTTTFNNVGDLGLPSGLFGDVFSVNGVLSATIAGGAFSGITVSVAGSGYQQSPLVLTTTTAGGVINSIPAMVAIGATAVGVNQNPQVPIQSTGLPYGSLYAPYITAPGAGFTNAGPLTTLLEVEPFIDLQIYYNGKDTLYAAINGRPVLSIGPGGVTLFAAGATVNVATGLGPAYNPTTVLTSAVSPVLPTVGSAYNILPQVPMSVTVGALGSTANARALFVDELNLAVEMN